MCPSDEISRRAALKMRRSKDRAGAIPVLGTNQMDIPMARKSFNLQDIEKQAAGKQIASMTVRYGAKEVTYLWSERKRANLENATKVKLDFLHPKMYLQDGDCCIRDGLRLKPK